jgi:hypothetical protein
MFVSDLWLVGGFLDFIMFVSDLWLVGGFLQILQFPAAIKLTATI